MKNKNSHQFIQFNAKKNSKENKQKHKARIQVTLDTKRKPQALDTPDDFSEYTIKNFPGYKTHQ